MLDLVFSQAGTEIFAVPLDRSSISVGRSPTSDVQMPVKTVSRDQFELFLVDGRARIRNRSERGTLLNGRSVNESDLEVGDKIEFGSFVAVLHERIQESDLALTGGAVGNTAKMTSEEESASKTFYLEGQIGGRLRRFRLSGTIVTVGCDPGNTVIVEDSFASGFHCQFYLSDGGWHVKDQGSTNGTFVDGVRVKNAQVEIGQTISLGKTKLQIKDEGTCDPYPKVGDFVSIDPSTSAMRKDIEYLAQIDDPVLILGESGAGKEVVAQSIHKLSSRKLHKMVAANCSRFRGQLIDSELFGHEKGSFTGASSLRQGLFEYANKSSIFLDEIGDMPLETQAILLRTLENGEITRVGSNNSIITNARVIAATNKPIREMVKNGTFREDLYNRLKGHVVYIPPLRERREDIALLTRYFLEQEATSTGPLTISEEALTMLHEYDYPANVRDLKHVLRRASHRARFNHNTRIESEDLQLDSDDKGKNPESQNDKEGAKESEELSRLQELKKKSRAVVNRAVKAVVSGRQSMSEASRVLGVPRTTLRRKVNQSKKST